jgi:hypothetical protein
VDTDGSVIWSLDPYGAPDTVIGNGRDGICLAVYPLPTGEVLFGSVLNSETGHCIEDFRHSFCVGADQAVETARDLTMDAATRILETLTCAAPLSWNRPVGSCQARAVLCASRSPGRVPRPARAV